MIALIVGFALCYVLVWVLALGLCQSAARGDEALEKERWRHEWHR